LIDSDQNIKEIGMNSRDRVITALHHTEPDMVPLDLGSTAVTGMHASSVYKLRQALHLDPPGTPVKVTEPYQMLGEIAPNLLDAVGADVIMMSGPRNFFGFRNDNWKPWTFWDGTPLLVPECFNTTPEADGSILMYPEGDHSVPPSGKMPAGGFYFDSLDRQQPIDDDRLSLEDNLEEFGAISDADLNYYKTEIDRLYTTYDKAVLGSFGGTSFGDIALVPATQLKNPRGIRGVEEWYMSTVSRKDFIYKLFERQCEIALGNLEKIYQAVGNKIVGAFVTGTDFGAQNGTFISRRAYLNLYQPFHREITSWIHKNTEWKCFIHSCGSVVSFIPDFIDAGFDILNPVQTSASGMDPVGLKTRFGDQITFWGGGIDTQKTLPFGTPDQIRTEVKERMKIFGANGGFVFNSIHNIQAGIPAENLQALYDAINEFRKYPME
jgi:hypothetical protein